jgi:hypothetical protein
MHIFICLEHHQSRNEGKSRHNWHFVLAHILCKYLEELYRCSFIRLLLVNLSDCTLSTRSEINSPVISC